MKKLLMALLFISTLLLSATPPYKGKYTEEKNVFTYTIKDKKLSKAAFVLLTPEDKSLDNLTATFIDNLKSKGELVILMDSINKNGGYLMFQYKNVNTLHIIFRDESGKGLLWLTSVNSTKKIDSGSIADFLLVSISAVAKYQSSAMIY